MCLIYFFKQKGLLDPIEQQVKKIKEARVDEFQPLAFNKLTKVENYHQKEIIEGLNEIQKQIQTMTLDLQTEHQKQELLDGESKEEILENERHRLARELHDSVSQQLFAAMMIMSALNETIDRGENITNFSKQIQMVAKILSMAQSEMRALLLHLRPINLEGRSLKQGIEQLLVELQSKVELKIIYDVEEVSIQPSIENELFRVVQELLSNTLRHAKASELELYLNQSANQLVLRIQDDGVGFDTSKKKAGSYGLLNVKERISSVGGTVKIVSIPNQGTSIEIKIPLIDNEVRK
ncbi:sensor histidine kinase [Enterococcus cecorum]|nr:sensor histidine kinase [Enterococcus cecorum]MCJ0597780.1 sensor histidine kinase [Enterococcus cecorum]